MLGGSSGEGSAPAIGKVIGPAFSAAEIPTVVEKILDIFVSQRVDGEAFVELVNRIGLEDFKRVLYPERKGINTGKPFKINAVEINESLGGGA